MRRYRAGIIGWTGRGDFGHGLDVVYAGMPEIEVAAVADPDPDGRRRCAVRTGAAAGYADYREMLEKVRPEVVSVAPRWVDCHREMVLACAEAGVKAVYCEKPFARALAEADEMLAACRRAGTRIAVAHQNRALPPLERVRSLIREGAIGKLVRIRGKGKDDRRGGAEDLVVLGTHVLDLMRALAGDPAWGWGHIRQGDRDLRPDDVAEGAEGLGPLGGNNLTAYFAFPAGVAGTYESYVSRGGTRMMGLWIEGTEGTITFHGGFRKEIHLCRQPQWTPELGAGAWERIRVPEWENGPDGHPRSDAELLNLANQRIVRSLLESVEMGTAPIASGEDARWAMEMYFAVPESQRTGGRVAIPLKTRESAWAALRTGKREDGGG